MALRSAAALLLFLAAATASADGPRLRVLASSGVVIDDLPIARFERPGLLRSGRIVFRGVSTALVHVRDGVDVPYLRTGDALAAPLDGTINEIGAVAMGPNAIAVAADVNSSQATGVILVDDGTGPRLAVEHDDDRALVGVEINAASDLLYWTSAALYAHPAGGPSEVIDTLSARRRLAVPPVLADGPTAAWMTGRSRGGVSYWSPATGTLTVAEGNFRRTTRVRRLGVAMDPRVGVAYLRASTGSATGAFLWSVADRVTSKLAAIGSVVEDRSIRRFHGPIVFEDDGAVAFEVDLRGSQRPRNLRTYVRAKDGRLTPTGRPAEPESRPLRLDRRGALFVVAGEAVTPFVRPGDSLVGGGTVASVESHAAHGDGVAAVVTLREGGEAVVRRRGARLVPLGGLEPDADYSLASALPATTPRVTALFTGEVLVGRRRLAPIEVPKRFANDLLVQDIVGGDRLLAIATFGACDGLFAVRGHRLVPLLIAGAAPACGRRRPLASIDALAANRNQVVVVGTEPQTGFRLYRVQRKGVARLGTKIGPVALEPFAVVLAGDHPVFVAGSPEDPALMQVFLSGTPDATPLVREGDPTPIGRIGFAPSDVFGGSSNEILVTAGVSGGGVRRALVAQSLPR